MRTETLKPGLAAPLLEPITKRFDRVRAPPRRHQINQVSDLRSVDTLAQRRQYGQFVGLDGPRAALGFGKHQLAVALHLRPEPHDVASAHPGKQQKIECQPRLGANRVARLIARCICLGPCPNSVGIPAAQLSYVSRRVLRGIPILGRSRPREQLPQCFDAVIGRFGIGGFFIAQLRNVLRLHCREPEIAGAPANIFKDSPTDFAGGRREQLEGGGRVILLAQPPHCPRHSNSLPACWNPFQFAAKGALIFSIKSHRAGHLGEADLWLPFAPEINSHIAVPVDILDDVSIEADATLVAQPNLHHKASHSFLGPPSSSSASNASSSLIRSHTMRPSIRFGLGIRPSSIISSNFVTPTPMYSAAWARDRPRGTREGGKQLTEFRTIGLPRLTYCGPLLPKSAGRDHRSRGTSTDCRHP